MSETLGYVPEEAREPKPEPAAEPAEAAEQSAEARAESGKREKKKLKRALKVKDLMAMSGDELRGAVDGANDKFVKKALIELGVSETEIMELSPDAMRGEIFSRVQASAAEAQGKAERKSGKKRGDSAKKSPRKSASAAPSAAVVASEEEAAIVHVAPDVTEQVPVVTGTLETMAPPAPDHTIFDAEAEEPAASITQRSFESPRADDEESAPPVPAPESDKDAVSGVFEKSPESDDDTYEVQESDLIDDAAKTERAPSTSAETVRDPFAFDVDVVSDEAADKTEVVAAADAERVMAEQRLGALGIENPAEYIAKHPKSYALRLKKMEMDRVRENYAAQQTRAKKLQGDWRPRFLGGATSAEIAAAVAAAESSEQNYEAMRAEYVGEAVFRKNAEALKLADEQGEQLLAEKGFAGKFREMHRALGEMNLEKLGWKPTSRVGKMIAKGVNARAVIGAGCAVGGFAAGGGIVAVGLLGFGKALRGVTSALGSYDVMRGVREREKLVDDFELTSMDDEALGSRVAEMQARAALGGRRLSGNEEYLRLKTELGKRTARIADHMGDRAGFVQILMAHEDENRAKAVTHEKRVDRAMMAGAAAIGVASGSGLVGKGFGAVKEYFFGGADAAVAVAQEAAPAPAPENSAFESAGAAATDAAEAGPSVEEAVVTTSDQSHFGLSEVRPGDGYARIISRQLASNPEKFGYKPEVDGDAKTWIARKVGEIVRKNGLVGEGNEMRLRYDAAKPSFVFVDTDLNVMKLNVDQYAAGGDAAMAAENGGPAGAATITAENRDFIFREDPYPPKQPGQFDAENAARAAKRADTFGKLRRAEADLFNARGGADAEVDMPKLKEPKPGIFAAENAERAGARAETLASLRRAEEAMFLANGEASVEAVPEPSTAPDVQATLARAEAALQRNTAADVSVKVDGVDVQATLNRANAALERFGIKASADASVEAGADAEAEASSEAARKAVEVNAAAASGQPIELDSFLGRGTVRFDHSPFGAVTGVNFTYQAGGLRPDSMLKEDWLSTAAEKSDLPEWAAQTRVEGDAREVLIARRVLKDLIDRGVNGRELAYMKDFVRAKEQEMVADYGDILK